MIGGTINVARDIFTDDAFRDEPLTEREAFLWLCMEASIKPREREFNGYVVRLERGQLAASSRFLAEAWSWERTKVRRFLKRLEAGGQVHVMPLSGPLKAPQLPPHPSAPPLNRDGAPPPGAGCSVITILRYDKYQRGGRARQEDVPHPSPADVPHPRAQPTAPKENKGIQKGNREREIRARAGFLSA